jgi:DNA-directed RNA polymerase subunit alpha
MEVEQVSESHARVSIFPFEAGFAITLAHPIKRLVLSSTVGYAPTALKIEGASHEFDSIRGVSEDAAALVINLKNIRFSLKGEETKATVNFSFKGPKEVKGSDFESEEVEVATPDAHFATINEDGELNLSIVIEKGMGYVPSEDIREDTEEGYLPLDAIFMPVKKANYQIEKMLVEDNPNYEKIVFDIVSDGSREPMEIFRYAVDTMYKQLGIFTAEFGIKSAVAAPKNKEDDDRLKKLLTKIEDLNLSARSHNCLTRASIKYVGEVALMSESELGKVKNLGKKSLDEIKMKMEEVGFPVGTELPGELASALDEKLSELKG